MKPPICKVCQKAHWTYDGHFVSEVQVPEYVKEMAAGALGGDRAPQPAGRYDVGQHMGRITVTKVSPQNVPSGDIVPIDNMTGKPDLCECGKANETGRSLCAACRKRAYRERSK